MKTPRLTYVAMASGGVLLLFGTVLFFIPIEIWRLVFCVGLGLILAALGTSATVKYKGATITGGGAIAVVLFVLLYELQPSVQWTRGVIKGDFSLASQVSLRDGDEMLLGALRGNSRLVYSFVLEDTLKFGTLDVDIADSSCDPECILDVPRKYVDRYVREKKPIEWAFDRKKGILTDASSGDTVGSVALALSPPPPRHAPYILAASYVEAPSPQQQADVPRLLDGLRSPYLRVREASRDQLAKIGVPAVRPLMDRFQQEKDNSLVRLGVVYTMFLIQRRHPAQVAQVRSQLTDADVRLLRNAASGDESRTVKVYARRTLDALRIPQ